MSFLEGRAKLLSWTSEGWTSLLRQLVRWISEVRRAEGDWLCKCGGRMYPVAASSSWLSLAVARWRSLRERIADFCILSVWIEVARYRDLRFSVQAWCDICYEFDLHLDGR